MTTGEYLLSISSSSAGASAMTAFTNIDGTMPVFVPLENFSIDMAMPALESDIKIEELSGNIQIESMSADLGSITTRGGRLKMNYKRVRGDDYPFRTTIKVNGEEIDISGSEIKFSYKNAENEPRTILGSIVDGELGVVEFVPQSGIDFVVSGVYEFDVQRVAGGYTYTHLKGTLLLSDDVTA